MLLGAEPAGRASGPGGASSSSSSSGPPLNLSEVKKPIFETFHQLQKDFKVHAESVERDREAVRLERAAIQKQKEVLITKRRELEAERDRLAQQNLGFFSACFFKPISAPPAKADAELDAALEDYITSAFHGADITNNDILTIEEIRLLEGANAERVLREADVNANESLTLDEYKTYKKRVLQEVGHAAAEAFDLVSGGAREISLAELEVIEGDQAANVMREADVYNNGKLSKAEFVDYKKRKAIRGRFG